MNEKGIPNATQRDNLKLKNSPKTRQTKNNPITRLLANLFPNLEFNSKEVELVVVLKSIAPPIKFIEFAEDLEGEISFALTKLCLTANL